MVPLASSPGGGGGSRGRMLLFRPRELRLPSSVGQLAFPGPVSRRGLEAPPLFLSLGWGVAAVQWYPAGVVSDSLDSFGRWCWSSFPWRSLFFFLLDFRFVSYVAVPTLV